MYTAKALFSNYPLMCAVVGWFAAQICTIFTGMFRERSFDIVTALFGTGGMPSSHTAAVSALTVASAVSYGFGSFQFAISGVLTMIVIRDASGVRRSAGEQAKLVNRMIKTLSKGGVIDFTGNIKEIVGHTPFQVFVGALVGIAVPFLMMLIMPVR